MKPAIAPHASSATCVRIECVNGVVVRITDHPFDLAMSNATVYETDCGYSPTALSGSTTFASSAIDIEGIAAIGGLTRDQVASGVFDNARVFIFRTSYFSPVEDYEPVASGFFGKTEMEDEHYRIEGMSLIDALSQSVGKSYTAACSRTFGDAGCGISLAAIDAAGAITSVTSARVFTDSSRLEVDDWFGAGTIKFTSGQNVGLRPLEIKSFTAGGVITTFEPAYYLPQIGDAFVITPGCRRRLQDCRDKYSNIVNFFGFPNIPTPSAYTEIGNRTS